MTSEGRRWPGLCPDLPSSLCPHALIPHPLVVVLVAVVLPSAKPLSDVPTQHLSQAQNVVTALSRLSSHN